CGVVVFFFFQAEDGIRDWSVTGVQTCALPISWSVRSRTRALLAGSAASTFEPTGCAAAFAVGTSAITLVSPPAIRSRVTEPRNRSEERRVGKECRDGRGAYA